jgi:hypothetical protein
MIKTLTKIERAKKDCIFFAENYLINLLPEKTGEFHKILIEIVNKKENDRLDILAPRGHDVIPFFVTFNSVSAQIAVDQIAVTVHNIES